MSAEKDKYRNPPPPLGYVMKEPRLVLTEKKKNGLDIGYLIDKLLESGICDEPDAYRTYEKFVVNPSSEDEDIVEVPYVPEPKCIDVVKVEDDENIPQNDNVVVEEKKCPPESVPPEKKVKTKQEEEKTKKHKKSKKGRDRRSSSSRRRRKHKSKREFDCESRDKRSPSKKLVDYDSESSSSQSRSRYKKEFYSNDGSSSDSVPNFRHKKESSRSRSSSNDYEDLHKEKINRKNKRDAHGRRRYKRRESYSSYSSDNESQAKKKSYYSDNSNSDIDNKSHLRSKYSHSSDSHNRRLKMYIDSDSNSSSNILRNCDRELRGINERIKEEQSFLHGEFRCNICNVTLNNDTTYRSHMNGKRHKKAVEASKRTITPAYKVPLPDSKVSLPDTKVPFPDSKVPLPDSKVPLPDSKVPIKYPQHEDYYETFKNSSVPDPSKHGFYCRLCDSHCNSEAMWNSHIIGKRHLTLVHQNLNILELAGIPHQCYLIYSQRRMYLILLSLDLIR